MGQFVQSTEAGSTWDAVEAAPSWSDAGKPVLALAAAAGRGRGSAIMVRCRVLSALAAGTAFGR